MTWIQPWVIIKTYLEFQQIPRHLDRAETHHQQQQLYLEIQVISYMRLWFFEKKIIEFEINYHTNPNSIFYPGACDVARNYLSDILEFLSDVHTLSKVKSNVKGTVGLNEDTLGGTLKASLAQYLALEISKGNTILLISVWRGMVVFLMTWYIKFSDF